MTRLAVIDDRELTVTPVFKIIELENVPKSETAGHAVMETMEVVEVRMAGNKNVSPVFPTDAMWKREGNQVFTYAERWPDQYRAFKEGNPQEANGTPLEMLRALGVTPEQLSLCRTLRIYSIEALHHLEGQPLKTLGMHSNKLKAAAASFMADRMKGANALTEIDALRAEIAALKAAGALIPPVQDSTAVEIEKAITDAYADMSDGQIKDEIAKLNDGKRPQGNPSRASLVSMLDTLMAA